MTKRGAIPSEEQRVKARARERARYHANPDRLLVKRRAQSFLRNYGITIDERDHLLALQGNKCALCGSTDPLPRKNARPDRRRRLPSSNDPRAAFAWRWHVDHDHLTKDLRGVLCRRCNHLLGQFNDDAACLHDWMRKAITYLEDSCSITAARLETMRKSKT